MARAISKENLCPDIQCNISQSEKGVSNEKRMTRQCWFALLRERLFNLPSLHCGQPLGHETSTEGVGCLHSIYIETDGRLQKIDLCRSKSLLKVYIPPFDHRRYRALTKRVSRSRDKNFVAGAKHAFSYNMQLRLVGHFLFNAYQFFRLVIQYIESYKICQFFNSVEKKEKSHFRKYFIRQGKTYSWNVKYFFVMITFR